MRSARIATLALAVAVSGCTFFKVFTGPFQDVRPVPNKIAQPYRSDARLAVLWVGHATVLLQMDDRVILTDPVFTTTVGQLSKRVVEPGLEVSAVPPVDAALISHLHFDHLSLTTLDMLESKIRRLYVPPTAITYLPDYHFSIEELAWGKSFTDREMTVTAVPVNHNGWRYVFDMGWMKKAFTGYVLEYRGQRVYFGGDSGYGPHYKKTRAHFGDFDLAILPIAPIEPRALMAPNHLDPREALDAFADLGAKTMLAMHFETFPNSTDDPGDARRILREEAQKRGLDSSRVLILTQGEQRVLVSASSH